MRADRWRVKIKLFKCILPRRRNRETVFVKRTLLFVGIPVEYFPFLSTFGERTRARARRSFRIALLEILLLWSAISAIVSKKFIRRSACVPTPMYNTRVQHGCKYNRRRCDSKFNWTAKLKSFPRETVFRLYAQLPLSIEYF